MSLPGAAEPGAASELDSRPPLQTAWPDAGADRAGQGADCQGDRSERQMRITGRKDVAEAVVIAALSAAAVRLVDALADYVEKRRKAKKKVAK